MGYQEQKVTLGRCFYKISCLKKLCNIDIYEGFQILLCDKGGAEYEIVSFT